MWDLESGRSRTVGECSGVNALWFLADSARLVTGSEDGAVRVWNTNI